MPPLVGLLLRKGETPLVSLGLLPPHGEHAREILFTGSNLIYHPFGGSLGRFTSPLGGMRGGPGSERLKRA